MELKLETSFAEIIKKIHATGKLTPDLMKCENGNNFRAISEKAILDVLDPILEEQGIFYTVFTKDPRLEIREAYGAKGKKLQFIAWLTVDINFYDKENHYLSHIESVGMGIDDNDKAMGKAYTYAIKYGLLKLFRLRYGDDPDFEASKPLLTEPKAHAKAESVKAEKADEKKSHGKQPNEGRTLVSAKQLDYIIGLMKEKNVSLIWIKQKFGYKTLDRITMSQARDLIKFLQEFEPEENITDDDLPF